MNAHEYDEKLRKLQALVDRGATDGERRAAKRALEKQQAKGRPAEPERPPGTTRVTYTDADGRNPYHVDVADLFGGGPWMYGPGPRRKREWPIWLARMERYGLTYVVRDGGRCVSYVARPSDLSEEIIEQLQACMDADGWSEPGAIPGHRGQWTNRYEATATFTVERDQALLFIRGEGVFVTLPRGDGKPMAFECEVTGVVLPNNKGEEATVRVRVVDVAKPAAAAL